MLYLYSVHQGTAAPKRVVKASITSTSAGGLDSLPREDISSKITPNLLKGFESPDWKVLLNLEVFFCCLNLTILLWKFIFSCRVKIESFKIL